MEKTNLIFVGEHGFAWIGEKVPGLIPVGAVKWAPIPAIGALGWSNTAPQGVQQCLVAYRYNVSGKKAVGLASRKTPFDKNLIIPGTGPGTTIIAFWPLHQLEWTEFPKPESVGQALLTVEQAKNFAKDLMSSGMHWMFGIRVGWMCIPSALPRKT